MLNSLEEWFMHLDHVGLHDKNLYVRYVGCSGNPPHLNIMYPTSVLPPKEN